MLWADEQDFVLPLLPFPLGGGHDLELELEDLLKCLPCALPHDAHRGLQKWRNEEGKKQGREEDGEEACEGG